MALPEFVTIDELLDEVVNEAERRVGSAHWGTYYHQQDLGNARDAVMDYVQRIEEERDALRARIAELENAIRLDDTFPTEGPTLLEYAAYELEQHHVLMAAGELRRMAELMRVALGVMREEK